MHNEKRENMNERLAAATGRVAADLAERRAVIGRRGGEPGLGDTFFFRRTAGRGVEWAVVERRGDDGNLLVVPVDDFPFAGSRDVELPPASQGGVANVRCDLGVWLDPRAFRRERRTGMLPAEDLERVRGRRRVYLEGRLRSSLLEDEADDDPEYQRWRDKTLRPAAAELAAPLPEGWLQRLRRLLFPPVVGRWAVPVAAAASLVLAVGLARTMQEIRRLEDTVRAEHQRSEELAAARSELTEQLDASAAEAQRLDSALQQLRESSDATLEELGASRRELADRGARITELQKALLGEPHLLPFFTLQGWERDRSSRGLPTVLRLGDDPRLLALALEVEDPEPYLRYRLQIVVKGSGEVIWQTDELVKKGRWLSLVLPSGLFAAGTNYELRLAGLMDEEVADLEEKYLVVVRR